MDSRQFISRGKARITRDKRIKIKQTQEFRTKFRINSHAEDMTKENLF